MKLREWNRLLLSGPPALALLVSLPLACTFDPDDRCDAHERIYGDNNRCVCEEGSALTPNGCVPCGEHEVPGMGGCVCEAGYLRSAEGASCEPAPQALGADCSTTVPCADATFNHCQSAKDGTGYCTNTGCADSAECSGGYGCDSSVTPSVCLRPPLGLGKSCGSAEDCAGGEATFCDTFQSHQCLVPNCTFAPDNCFPGWKCTDLSGFGMPIPLCLPEGAL